MSKHSPMSEKIAARAAFYASLPPDEQREMVLYHAQQCWYRAVEVKSEAWCEKHPPVKKLKGVEG